MSGKILKTGCLAAELGKPENVIAIVNAVEEGIGNDPGAAQAIADAIADKLPIASTEQKGIVELATNAEAVAGTSTTLAVTPAGLKAAIDGAALPAQLPDDQVLSGDNSGTVGLTLTPTVVGGQTNYTIKADLKVAAQTPTSTTNMLKLSASGFYVSMEEVVDALIANPTKLAALAAALSTAMPDAFDA